MSRLTKKERDKQFEAFLKESGSDDSVNSEKVDKLFDQTESQPWWMEDDSDGDVGNGPNFLKSHTYGPTHSTPTDPKKDASQTSVHSLGASRESLGSSVREEQGSINRHSRGGEILSVQKGSRRFEGTLSKDSLEDISEKSEEDSESRKNKIQKNSNHPIATSLAATKSQTKENMGDSWTPAPLHDNTCPGPDTLDEMADKQMFFSELEKDNSGTLDYALLNRQLSKTSTQMATNSVDGNTKDHPDHPAAVDLVNNTPDTSLKEELQKPPSQQQTSLLSKVLLLDSMGSSLNTTGTSAPGDVASPAISKDVAKDTENQANQKCPQEFQGTVTSQEMKDLHLALQDINLSSTMPAVEIPPSVKPSVDATKDASTLKGSSSSPPAMQNIYSILEGHVQSGIGSAVTGETTAANGIVAESETTEQNQDSHPDPVELSSNEEPMEEVRGFDLLPVVVNNDPDHALSLSMITSTEPTNLDSTFSKDIHTLPTESNNQAHSLTQRKPTPYSNIPSSGYGQRSLPVSRPKGKASAIPAECSSMSKLPGNAAQKTTNVFNYKTVQSTNSNLKSKMASTSNVTTEPKTTHLQISDQPSRLKWPADPSGSNTTPMVPNPSGSSIIPMVPDPSGSRTTPMVPDPSGSRTTPMVPDPSCSSITPMVPDPSGSRTTPMVPDPSGSRTTPMVPEHDEVILKEVNYLKNQLEVEQRLIFQLKDKLADNETCHRHIINEQKQKFQREIDNLKKENFVLTSKVSNTATDGENLRKSSEEEVKLRKEVEEQQNLLAGYHTENQRLYSDAKQLKSQLKQAEERMFRENQKLLIELNNLRNQMELKEGSVTTHNWLQPLEVVSTSNNNSSESGGQSAMMASARLSQLEMLKHQNQEENNILKQHCTILEKTKTELESQISLLIQQKEEMRQALQEVKLGKREEFKVTESKFIEEIEGLKKKLHWYAYNQQLLDQDIAVFKQKDHEIKQLNIRIQELQSETGRRLEENKLRAKERTANQKRIQDLERQMLEEKVQKLETQLKGKEEEGDRRVRAVEQKYNKLKLQYEDQIDNMEEQVRGLQHKAILGDHPYSHKVALEKELESVRERHQLKVAEMQQEIEQLRSEATKLKKDDGSLRAQLQCTHDRETEVQAKSQVLHQQLETSHQQVTTLRNMVSKLQREKQVLSRQQTNQKTTSSTGDVNKNQKKSKKVDVVVVDKNHNEKKELLNIIPELSDDILRENEALKIKVEHLQFSVDHQNVESLKSLAESEAAFRRIHEKHQHETDALRAAHQRELHRILTEHTLRNSTSCVAELQSKVDAQQVLVNHLQEQLAHAQVDAEKMSALKVREVVLEARIQQLQDELEMAKSTQTPDRRHFQNLVEKVQDLEKKHEAREKELLNIIKNGGSLSFADLEKEVRKWKKIAESKNADIEKYRVELDSMLSVLHALQKQDMLGLRERHLVPSLYNK